jgi:asparagine N-glycosylation enzyme membrane subunit Stt3
VWQRQLVLHEWRWLLWSAVPALPVAAYLSAVFTTNPVVGLWLSQEFQQPFTLSEIVLTNSLMLVVAAPALWRAVRGFERDSDRLMLLWLLAIVVLGAFAPRFSNHFLMAITLPLAYFATRALDSVWLDFVRRPWQRWAYVSASLLLAITPLITAFSPLIAVLNDPLRSAAVLSRDYRRAVAWIDEQTTRSVVVLASPHVSVWIPAISSHRVVYGHPTETIFAASRRQEVLDWYSRTSRDDCALLATQQQSTLGSFYVEYALVGPEERQLGAAACAARWALVQTVGDVDIYQCDFACRTGSR